MGSLCPSERRGPLLDGLQALLEKEPAGAARMIVESAENLVAELAVEVRRLECVSVEPDADAAAAACDVFGAGENPRSDVLAAIPVRHHQQFHEQPVVDGLAPKAADGLATVGILDQDSQRLISRWPGGLVVEGDQGVDDGFAVGVARLLRNDDAWIAHIALPDRLGFPGGVK